MSLKIFELPVVPVISKDDPEWLKNLFGSFPSAINLAHDNFPHFTEWPEVKPGQKLGIVWFEDETFENWEAVDQRLTAEGYGPDKRTIPPQLAEIVPKCDELWQLRQEGKGPAWIYASDGKSVWRNAFGDLYLPYVDLNPGFRRVNAYWVKYKFDDNDGFLVVCE